MGDRKRHKPRVGDLFEVPIDDARVGYGQVIGERPHMYLVAIFKTAYPRGSAIKASSVVNDQIAFLAETLDAKIWNGDWPVVGNLVPDFRKVDLPVYKVGMGRADELHIETYDGKRHRRAKPSEVEALRFRTIVSAIVVQNALQASHQVIPWEEGQDGVLEYGYVQQWANVAV